MPAVPLDANTAPMKRVPAEGGWNALGTVRRSPVEPVERVTAPVMNTRLPSRVTRGWCSAPAVGAHPDPNVVTTADC